MPGMEGIGSADKAIPELTAENDPALREALTQAGLTGDIEPTATGATGVQPIGTQPPPGGVPETVTIGGKQFSAQEAEEMIRIAAEQRKWRQSNHQEAERVAQMRDEVVAERNKLQPLARFGDAMDNDPEFRDHVLGLAQKRYGAGGLPPAPAGAGAGAGLPTGRPDPMATQIIERLDRIERAQQGFEDRFDATYADTTWGNIAQKHSLTTDQVEQARDFYDQMLDNPEIIAEAAVLLKFKPELGRQVREEAEKVIESARGRATGAQVLPGAGGGGRTPRPLDLSRVTGRDALQIAEDAARHSLPHA